MPDVNQFVVLDDANKAIRRFYEERYLEIGEPVLITDVFAVLKNVGTVLDVTNVEFFIKSGDNYADSPFAVEEFLNADGTMLIPPSNCIFELKFPNSDIIGTIK